MIVNNLLGKNFNTVAEVAQFRVNLKHFLLKNKIVYNNEDAAELLLGKAVVNGFLDKNT